MKTCVRAGWPWLCAAASGGLMALCFPPWNQSWLAWVALAPAIAALWLSDGPRPHLRCAALGFVTGLSFFLITFFWLTTVTVLGWMLLPFYLALYPALWGWFTGVVARPRRALSAPANVLERSLGYAPPTSVWLSSWQNLLAAVLCALAWAGQEWLRGIVFTGFGWNGLGVALNENIPFIQLAALTGVGGLSFLLALAAATAVFTVKRVADELGRVALRPHYDFNIAVALIVLAFSYGMKRLQGDGPGAELRLAAVQPNVLQEEKWDPQFEEEILNSYAGLTTAAMAVEPHLILWPEAATPRGIFDDPFNAGFVAKLAARTDARLLLGTLERDGADDFNSVALLGPRGVGAQIYRKIHLVPFGEFVPFRNTFPLFAMVVGDLVPGDFAAGKEPVLLRLDTPDIALAPLVCFEDTVGRLVRRFARRGPNLLVNVTNDGWFLQSSGAEHHLRNAVFRTVETGLPMVRCANTGVTAFIDRFGRVRQSLRDETGSHFMAGTLMGSIEVPLAPPETVYVRFGEWFSVVALVFAGLAVLARGRRPLSGGGYAKI